MNIHEFSEDGLELTVTMVVRVTRLSSDLLGFCFYFPLIFSFLCRALD